MTNQSSANATQAAEATKDKVTVTANVPDATKATSDVAKAESKTVKETSPPTPPTLASLNLTIYQQEQWYAPWRGMQYFHNSHKRTFNRSYERAENYQSEHGQSLRQYLLESYNLVIHLGNHHAIEEAHIFPLLAKKHPAFRQTPNGEHATSHATIHEGLDRYEKFLSDVITNPEKYTPKEMREILDSFREPLMNHLDDEVRDLHPDVLLKHGFTLADVRRLPF